MRAALPVDGLLRRLQFAVLPARCMLCGDRSESLRDLCAACANDLMPNDRCCARCALPLPQSAAACGDCLQKAPAFDAAFAPFLYRHPFDLLMTKLKFGRSLAAGRVLSELWASTLGEALAAGTIALPQGLIPVPLHDQRLRERGYNQTLELARPIVRQFGIPLLPELLRRSRATAAQSDLDAKARRKNLRGAFQFQKSGLNESAANQSAALRRSKDSRPMPAHVVVFDDVMTTGATLHECARVLKKAGIARVDVWSLARAPRLS